MDCVARVIIFHFYLCLYVKLFLRLPFELCNRGRGALLQHHFVELGRNVAVGGEGHGHLDLPLSTWCLCWNNTF